MRAVPILEGKTPSERKKTIAAIVLGAIAIITLGYMFLGSSKSSQQLASQSSNTTTQKKANVFTPPQVRPEDREYIPQPINFDSSTPVLTDAGRNIFAYYVPPAPKPTPVPTPKPTPPPIPPNIVLASISPVNVYAHTSDFTMDLTGDKFTPETRVYIGGGELATRFITPQQLSARVPAQIISFEGAREIVVRSRDGVLFSNTATLNVMPAPLPNYTVVGVTLKTGSNDTAIMKEKNAKELMTVQRGDILGGRFRVTSISRKEVVLTDVSLKLKYPLPIVGDNANPGTGVPRYTPPPPPASEEDTEP